MCGFLGEFCFHEAKVTTENHFKALLQLSEHRGPDASNTYRAETHQLGFNRLAILDLSSHGNQPKQSPSKRFNIVFNGEIYNYKALAKQHNLQNLKSTSDTEVLIHLLDVLGVVETIKVLNGMFAIVIVDTKANTLFLARDFAGIKPLFYGISTKGVVMASQFDQVFKHQWHNKNLVLRPDGVKDYFGFGYMQAPHTIYESIYQVNPGELVTVEAHGSVSKQNLVEFNKEQEHLISSDVNTLETILSQAVKDQLVSDVPVATFLSGGIDSPLISAYAKQHKPNIEAFTVKVDDNELNESDIAQGYAKHLNIKQHIISVSQSHLLSHVNAHFSAYPEPFADYSSIPSYVITGEAKKQNTVMLSGDGGDELFFGYPRMRDVLKKRFWFKYPLVFRKIVVKITNTLGLTNTYAPYFKDIDSFIMNKHIHLPSPILDKAFSKTEFSSAITSKYKFKNASKKKLVHELRWNEFYAHMQRILVKVDRSSMKHSLEVRVPFLDKNTITHAWQTHNPLNSKDDLKKDLKLALANKVPKALINKKKMGFTVPLLDWLHNELKEDVLEHIFNMSFYGEATFDSDVLKTYTRDFFDKKHNDAWGIWHIYAWQKWAAIHT